MRDSVPSTRYSSVCNVLRQWQSRSSLLIESTDSMIYEEIDLKVCHRDLGILISGNLPWTNHYDHICSRAYRMLGLLRRVFSATVCMIDKNNLYTSLIWSQMSYCSMIWRPNLIKDIKCLETVQRRATKFILSDYSSDYRVRLLSLNLLPS